MQAALQIPRRSLIWLLLALLAAMGPHLGRQPAWLLLVLGASVGWRYQVWCGRWPLPAWPVKTLLVAMSLVGVLLAYGSLIGVDPAMALLITGCALKLIESATPRDFLVLVFLAYFTAACNFIYEQEVPTAAYVLLALIVITAALVARHQGEVRRGLVNPMLLAGKMLVQAVPLMILMFVVFPRIAPLWSIPQPENHARTGPSDDMTPGDIAQLSRSTELAFRATFDGPVPPQRQLYWRGLVLSDFDGRRWSMDGRTSFQSRMARQGARQISFEDAGLESSGQMLDYEVILEPTWQNWAFALDVPLRSDPSLRWTSDISLVTHHRVTQRVRYRATSDPEARWGLDLRPNTKRVNLSLPVGFNPRAREMALAWREEAGSDRGFIDRLLDWYNREAFVYTLSPPLLGRHSVDEFLFDTRRGFCEHYASSFVFLLRAAGIPARVVVGYQGGEQNSYEEYLLIYQYDAHAWTEIWLEGEGWVRYDPTAAVAPERVESSLQDVMGSEMFSSTSLSLSRFKHINVLNWLRMNWDLVGYHWARLVLGYDREQQFDLLRDLLGKVTPQRMVLFLLASAGTILALIALSLLHGRSGRPLDPATREYMRFCRRLARLGLRRNTGEGPLDFAARVAGARPELAVEVAGITSAYVDLSYGGGSDFMAFRQQVRRFRARPR